MKRLMLINPNTSAATTAMMVAAAETVIPPGWAVDGATARVGATMILDEVELAVAAAEVEALVREADPVPDAVVVAAFGDPGLAAVRAGLDRPVAGLCEASLRAASAGSTPFAIATVTPDLARVILGKVEALGLEPLMRGLYLTEGDPRALADDPDRLDEALGAAVEAAFAAGAERVIIGGGPLTDSALRLASRYPGVVAPVAAAVVAVTG